MVTKDDDIKVGRRKSKRQKQLELMANKEHYDRIMAGYIHKMVGHDDARYSLERHFLIDLSFSVALGFTISGSWEEVFDLNGEKHRLNTGQLKTLGNKIHSYRRELYNTLRSVYPSGIITWEPDRRSTEPSRLIAPWLR